MDFRMTPQQENLAIDLSAAFDVAAQGLLDAAEVKDPETRLAMVERAIAYTLVRAAIEATRGETDINPPLFALHFMLASVSRQARQMAMARPIADAIRLCAPETGRTPSIPARTESQPA
jgi:hypothetical protein